MTTALDPSLYVRAPRLGVASGLSLGKMLLTVVPKKPGPGVTRAAKQIAKAVSTLEKAWKEQAEPQRVVDARPYDHRLDRAWSSVHNRLSHYDNLAGHGDRERALEIDRRLFPRGLDFIVLPFLAQHAESARRVDLVDGDDELRGDLERLVGETFVQELLEAHKDYGAALGITKAAAPSASAVSMVEPLRVLSQAIAAYALQVLAFADLEPGNGDAARRALEPIDKFRRASGRRGTGGVVPEVPPGEDLDVEIPPDAPAPDAPIPDVPEA